MITYTATRDLTEINKGRLSLEISALSLTQTLQGINFTGSNIINCLFTTVITSGDETAIDTAIAVHNKTVADQEDAQETADALEDDLIDLSDVEIESTESIGSVIYKAANGKWKAIYEQVLYKAALTVQTSTSGTNIVNTSIPFPRTGNYIIDISYSWSYDSTTTDIITEGTVAGITLDPLSYKTHRQEPKDSSGKDNNGKGTDQVYGFANNYIFNNTSVGNKNLIFKVQSASNGIEAAIWNLIIKIKEAPNLTIL